MIVFKKAADIGRFLHLAADLVDGRRHFLGGRRHRLHVGGSLFRGRRDGGREFLRALGGRRAARRWLSEQPAELDEPELLRRLELRAKPSSAGGVD